MVFASLNTARVKAQDARRITDLREMRKALELYYDTNGSYPSSGWIKSSDTAWSDSNTAGTLANVLQPYIPSLPKDPINSTGWPYANANASTYAYNGGNNTFELLGHFEDTSNPMRCEIKKYRRAGSGNVWCEAPTNGSNYLFTNDPN